MMKKIIIAIDIVCTIVGVCQFFAERKAEQAEADRRDEQIRQLDERLRRANGLVPVAE